MAFDGHSDFTARRQEREQPTAVRFLGATTHFTIEEHQVAAELGCSFTKARLICAERRKAD